jgi:hypothetical protein
MQLIRLTSNNKKNSDAVNRLRGLETCILPLTHLFKGVILNKIQVKRKANHELGTNIFLWIYMCQKIIQELQYKLALK